MFRIQPLQSAKLGLIALATCFLLLSATGLTAGEPRRDDRNRHDRPDQRDHNDRHGRPQGNSRGGFNFWVAPQPVRILHSPVVTQTVVVPAPEVISYSNGLIIQRNYSYQNGSIVYEDVILQSAPVVIRETRVIPSAPQPAWIDIIRGLGMNIRW